MATQATNSNRAVDKYFVRFSLAQRIEHIVLLVSFSLLALTGLPQKYAGNAFADTLISWMGGIETVRIIHRIAAVTIVLMSVYHVIVLGYKIWVRRTELTMLPGLKDLTDALDVVRYNLGLSKEHPRMPRYNFGEKVEYWAMVWGTVVMAITGFMLWNPISTARFLPGQVIPAAKAAHGGEAVLAVLAILIWHFYNVHVKMFNRSMFSGKMSRHQMEEEHGEELEQRVAGKMRPGPDPAGVRRRERIYLPIAIVLALIGVFAVYQFATFEQTAIATLPVPIERQDVFTPLTPTPGPSLTQVAAALIPHPVQGQEQCDTCHGRDGVKPFPEDHVGRPNESCTVCHLPGPTPAPGATTGTGGPAAIPHPIEGDTYKDCTTCHGEGKLKPYPANHTAFTTEQCTSCHKPAAAAGATPAAGTTPEAGASPEAAGTATTGGQAGGPAPIPHPIEGDTYKDCTTCHGEGKLKPFPANHTAFPVDSCTGCHKPAAAGGTTPAAGATATTGGQAGGPAPIPHPIEGDTYKDCTTCHGEGKIKPYPANHTAFTDGAVYGLP